MSRRESFIIRLQRLWRKYDERVIILLLVVTIALQGLASLYPSLIDLTRLYPLMTFTLLFLVFTTLVVQFSEFERRLQEKVQQELDGTKTLFADGAVYEDVLEAIQALAPELEGAETIDILTYTSETLEYSIRRLKIFSAKKVRLLIRNPYSAFKIPDTSEWVENRKAFIRKECIPDWKALMMEQGVQEWEIRGYDFDPQVKALIIDRKIGFFGYYRIFKNVFESENGTDETTYDYQGKGQPVVRLSDRNIDEHILIAGFLSWFDTVWDNFSVPLRSNMAPQGFRQQDESPKRSEMDSAPPNHQNAGDAKSGTF